MLLKKYYDSVMIQPDLPQQKGTEIRIWKQFFNNFSLQQEIFPMVKMAIG